ncbi:MAG: AAA family ATPase, partial [Microthrixaceae bacterium]
MRPLRLQLSAIGPFASSTEVRFDDLADEGLFLIHGPTGSGKTFLLDALTFALYGAVGSDRAVTGLRSDHAEPHTPSFVELEFLAQGHRWKIHRTPQHERPKKRGSGTTTEQSRAVLFRLDAGEWRAVADRTSEVADQVRDLVGLTHRQFTQVILLPQGRFEAVLRADSAEREGLLKSLFDTELYERISDHLEHGARQAEAARGASDDELDRLRRQAWDRWLEIRGLVGANDLGVPGDELARDHLLDDVPGDQVQLDLLADEASSATKVATRRAADAADRLSTARDEHHAVTSLCERYDRRAELVLRATRLRGNTPDIDATRRRLALASAATSLRPLLEDAHAAQEQLAQADDGTRSAAGRVTRAWRAVPVPMPATLPEDLASIGTPADLDPARSAVASAIAQVSELSQVDHRRGELVTAIGRAEAEADDADVDAARHRQAAAAATEGIEPARRSLAQATAAGATLPGLRAAAAAAATRLDAVRRLGAAHRELAAATDDHETARATANLAHERWNDARSTYLDGIAAVLAAQLAAGEHCPVCGSDDHPHPARPVDGAVTLEQVDAAEQVATLADHTRDQAAERRSAAAAEVDRLTERAGDVAADPAAALDACESAAQQVQQAQAAAQAEPAARAALDAATAACAQSNELAEQAELRAAAARARAATLGGELQRCEQRLAEQLGTDVPLHDALAALRRVDTTLSALAAARTDLAVARAT